MRRFDSGPRLQEIFNKIIFSMSYGDFRLFCGCVFSRLFVSFLPIYCIFARAVGQKPDRNLALSIIRSVLCSIPGCLGVCHPAPIDFYEKPFDLSSVQVNSTIVAMVSGEIRPLAISVESDSLAECRLVEVVLIGCLLDELPERLIGDKAYDSDKL